MKILKILAAIALAGLALLALAWWNAWSILGYLQESRDARAEVRMTPLRGTVHLIEATLDGERPFDYVASLASLGPDGALIVDPMVSAALAGKISTLLEEHGTPVRFVVNTHAHPDHTRGNVVFTDGAVRIAHERAAQEMASSLEPFPLLPATDPLPPAAVPGRTFRERDEIELNGERVVLRHFGPAHTAGDALVVFEEARVIHAGDVFLGGGRRAVAAPISGGTFPGLLATLDRLLELAPDDALIVGGHGDLGAVSTVEDVRRYRAALQASIEWVDARRDRGEISDEEFAAADLPAWNTWNADEKPAPLLRAIEAALR